MWCSDFRDWRIADSLRAHTYESCGLILSSMSRRRAKLGQYENVDVHAYMSSVGAATSSRSRFCLLWGGMPARVRVCSTSGAASALFCSAPVRRVIRSAALIRNAEAWAGV